MNGFEFRGNRRSRSGSISIGPLIVVAAVLVGAAVAIVVAVRAAGPGPSASTPANPLRSSEDSHGTSSAKLPAEQPAATEPKAVTQPAAQPATTQQSAERAAAELPPAAAPGEHPLDPAIALANKVLENLKKNVKDYTCIIAKQERTGDTLGEQEFMIAKIRQDPFSVYLKFLKPDDARGREVIYVAGANDGNLLVREGSGWKRSLGMISSLKPTGVVPMMGNRYPITDLGLTHLTERLLEIGRQDRRYGDIEVHFFKNAKVNGRVCTCVEVVHPIERRAFLFYKAQIFIDDQLNVPIRYAAYMWPKKEGDEAPLDECYTYLKLKLNVGLTDADFDPHNPNYHFSDK